MWEKFPRGKTPPLPQYGNFFDEMPFFSEDVPKQKNFKIVVTLIAFVCFPVREFACVLSSCS